MDEAGSGDARHHILSSSGLTRLRAIALRRGDGPRIHVAVIRCGSKEGYISASSQMDARVKPEHDSFGVGVASQTTHEQVSEL